MFTTEYTEYTEKTNLMQFSVPFVYSVVNPEVFDG
jgi:hypothetical protein